MLNQTKKQPLPCGNACHNNMGQIQNGNLTVLQKEIQDQLMQSEGDVFAVFDFDNTCIVNDILEATLAFVCKNRL